MASCEFTTAPLTTAPTTTSSFARRAKKRVSFSDLTVTEYPIILGENPACQGCPITIDWKPMGRYTCDLEMYEQFRQMGRSQQRSDNALLNPQSAKASRRKMVLSVRTRTQMLLDAGYTPEQIIKRTLEVAEVRDQREESIRRSASSSSFFSSKRNSLNTFGARNALFQKDNKPKLSEKFRKSFVKLGNLGGSSNSPRPSRKTLTARSA